MPWSYVADGNFVFTGMDAGSNFGRPGLLHMVLGIILILFFSIPKLWTKRTNIFIAATNLAWSIKNFILVGTCYMGVCPQRKPAVYILVAVCFLIQLASFFPNIKLQEEK